MSSTSPALPPALIRTALVLGVALALTFPPLHGRSVASAAAAPRTSATASAQLSATASAALGVRAVRYAATRRGARYHLGSAGPRAFDCSGLTQWSFQHAGERLPRSAQQQWQATAHVRAVHRRPGDLVFFFHGRHAYHVAIYAGAGRIWHAPKPGSRVKKVLLWTTKVRYSRVLTG